MRALRGKEYMKSLQTPVLMSMPDVLEFLANKVKEAERGIRSGIYVHAYEEDMRYYKKLIKGYRSDRQSGRLSMLTYSGIIIHIV